MNQMDNALTLAFKKALEEKEMADNKDIAKQRQDKSKLSKLSSTVKKTDKKDNAKKPQGVKDRR
jgi:hypothetical protein